MKKQCLIIDLTCHKTPGCLLEDDKSLEPNVSFLKTPLRAVVNMESGRLKILTGEAAEIFQPGEDSLVFYNLVEDLPEIKDGFVQSELTASFWSSICFTASKRLGTTFDSDSAGVVVYPYNYSSNLLEAIRLGCSRSDKIKDVVFVSEAAALIFGIVYNDLLKISALEKKAESRSKETVAAIIGYDEKNVEIVCFDYDEKNKEYPRILIRDFFKTSGKNLTDRLKKCEWLAKADINLFLDSENFDNSVREEFIKYLQKIIPEIRFEQNFRYPLYHLKSCGAFYIAKHSMGAAADLREFELINTANIGIRTDRFNFCSILKTEDFKAETKYPFLSAKTFSLLKTAEQEYVFSIHAGYSSLVAESVELGSLSIDAADISRLKGENKSELIAVACLNTPGEGEFTLGLMPDNRIIGKLPFVLPGMVC